MTQMHGDASTGEAAKPTPARSNRMGVRSLLVLVGCCGAMLWAYRYLSENYDPVSVEYRTILKRSIVSLRSGNTKEQLAAIEAMARLPKEDKTTAVAALSEALEDRDPEVRLAAAELLHQILDWEVSQSSLADEVLSTAEAALIRCLKSPDQKLRVKAVETLGSISMGLLEGGTSGKRFDDATAALVASRKDQNPRVREAVTYELGRIASPKGKRKPIAPSARKILMDAVVESLGDDDANVRHAAIVALSRNPIESGEPPTRLAYGLTDTEAANRVATIQGLSYYRVGLDPWIPLLFPLLEHDPDPKVRETVANIIGYAFNPPAITPSALPFLAQCLGSPNVKVRSHAASLLGRLRTGAHAAIPELILVLNEPIQPDVAPVMGLATTTFDPGCAAAFALGQIAPGTSQSKEVITALMEVVESGPVSRRGWAAAALGEFGSSAEAAVPLLIQVIKDAAPEGRPFELEASAAKALGKVAFESPSANHAIEALLPLLESKVDLNRQTAIEALREFGPNAAVAIPRLRELKKDRSDDVRNAAANALDVIE